MSLTRPFTFLSLAHFFFIFALASSFVVPDPASAADTAKCDKAREHLNSSKCKDTSKLEYGSAQLIACEKAEEDVKSCSTKPTSESQFESTSCKALDRVESKKNELSKTCSKAGYGRNCITAIQQCEQLGDSDESEGGKGISSAFFQAVAQNIGATNFDSTGNKCPLMAGKDYFRDKKDIEKDIKDNSKDLADLKKESAELEDSFNKDIQDVQEGITEAQEKLKSDKLDMNKEQRQRTTEAAKTTTEVAAQIRAKLTQNLSIRNQMAEVYRSKNSNLLQMSETASKLACMKKVRELRKSYDSEYAGASNKGGLGFIQQASKKKQELNDTFVDCMSQFNIQRNALIEQTEEKIQAFQDMINNNISDIDNATQQLESMKTQEQQAKADDTTKMNDASQSVSDKITKAQSRLTSLASTQQKKAKALSDKQAEMEGDSRKKSNELASLGPVPKSKSSTASLEEVSGDFSNYEAALRVLEIEANKKDSPCASYTREKYSDLCYLHDDCSDQKLEKKSSSSSKRDGTTK